MARPKQRANPVALADQWNKDHPPGTAVRFWKTLREGPGIEGVTVDGAYVLSGHTAVVFVEGVTGCVALTHVEAISP